MTKKLFVIFFPALLFLVSVSQVSAQSFSFSPQTGEQTVGTEFKVTVVIDAGSSSVVGADLKITYDPTLLEVVKVERGDFFSKGGLNSTSGLLYISYGIDPSASAKTGSGDYAILTLKGLKAGTGLLTVTCSNQSTDSNIWDAASKDIIVCTTITNPSFVFSGSSVLPSASPSLTVATSSALTATPTPPVSGITGPTFFALGMGLFLTIIGLVFLF